VAKPTPSAEDRFLARTGLVSARGVPRDGRPARSSNELDSSTWALMIIGFAGLGYAGYRGAREPRAA
jgi:hypothetical protein